MKAGEDNKTRRFQRLEIPEHIDLNPAQLAPMADLSDGLLNRLLSGKWLPLSRSQLKAPSLAYPGIYIIGWGNEAGPGKSIDIKHICYVGITNSRSGVGGRLGQFLGAASGGTQKHSGGRRFQKSSAMGTSGVPSTEDLLFSFLSLKCDVHKDRRSLEDIRIMGLVAMLEYELLGRIKETCGEEPVLNAR